MPLIEALFFAAPIEAIQVISVSTCGKEPEWMSDERIRYGDYAKQLNGVARTSG